MPRRARNLIRTTSKAANSLIKIVAQKTYFCFYRLSVYPFTVCTHIFWDLFQYTFFIVVCCCKLNNTQVCDEHLFRQVSTCTGLCSIARRFPSLCYRMSANYFFSFFFFFFLLFKMLPRSVILFCISFFIVMISL